MENTMPSLYIGNITTEINKTPVMIQKFSKYEIPWAKDKSDRPADYPVVQ
jgi:hypothetical protein